MKYLKTYENSRYDVKKGDYVIFIAGFDGNFVKKNYPYIVEYTEPKRASHPYGTAWIACDDGETRSFRAKNSTMYKKISKEDAETLLLSIKYNII